MLSNLLLQVIIYFNGWYDVFYFLVMLALYVWKGVTLPYPAQLGGMLALEICLLFLLGALEYARLLLAARGNKTERATPLIVSLLLSFPNAYIFFYYLFQQVGCARAASRLSPWAQLAAPPPFTRPHPPAHARGATGVRDASGPDPRRHRRGCHRPRPALLAHRLVRPDEGTRVIMRRERRMRQPIDSLDASKKIGGGPCCRLHLLCPRQECRAGRKILRIISTKYNFRRPTVLSHSRFCVADHGYANRNLSAGAST